MKIAFLATGDEILYGDTLNSNTKALAERLTSEGFEPGMHLVVGDNESDIINALNFLKTQHEIIITIGGLGPTSDDLTRFAIARFCRKPLKEYKAARLHIEKRLKQIGLSITEQNRKQALFPPNTTLLPNPYGSAYGGIFSHQNHQFILLPGPPKEALPMFDHHVLQHLHHMKHRNWMIRRFFIFGVPESEIASRLDATLSDLNCKTGYRIDLPYLECKVMAASELMPTIEKRMTPLLTPHIISPQNQKASQQLLQWLCEKRQAISIEDSATGGLLEVSLLTPNTAPWIQFNPPKRSHLHCTIKGLTAYWKKEESLENTLYIQVTTNTQTIEEKHILPKRSKTILPLYALEWIAFRLFSIFNKLHH